MSLNRVKSGWKRQGWLQRLQLQPPQKSLRLSLPSGERRKVALIRPLQSVPGSWLPSTISCRLRVMSLSRPKSGWKRQGWPQRPPLKPPLKSSHLSLPSGGKRKVALSRQSQSVPGSWRQSTNSCRPNVTSLNRPKSGWSRPDWQQRPPPKPPLKSSHLNLPSGGRQKVVLSRPSQNGPGSWQRSTNSCRPNVTNLNRLKSGWSRPDWLQKPQQKPPLRSLRLSWPSGEMRKVALSRPSQSVPRSWLQSTVSCRPSVTNLNRLKSGWSRLD